ncbi:Rieske 2Fe-2S domain-containing protein [Paraburkholderia sacchari]|uniref:Rieske (2Fe-2S) protein n=1 Tax=Paraburkholderia sacchari TaxID=159450 RepID=UPI0039A4BB3F
MKALADVASTDELPPGAQRTVLVGTARVLLYRDPVTNCIWALEDKCGHAFQPLFGGVIQKGVIQCPKHGACFDLATGQPTNAVTNRPVKTYAVVVRDNRILVSMNVQAPSAS